MRLQDVTTSFHTERPRRDIEEDSNLFYADPVTSDDQELCNDQIPQLFHFEPMPETVEHEEINAELRTRTKVN